jgi:hypothetical protein
MDMHRREVMAMVVSKLRDLAWRTSFDLLVCCAVSSVVNMPLHHAERVFLAQFCRSAARWCINTLLLTHNNVISHTIFRIKLHSPEEISTHPTIMKYSKSQNNISGVVPPNPGANASLRRTFALHAKPHSETTSPTPQRRRKQLRPAQPTQ